MLTCLFMLSLGRTVLFEVVLQFFFCDFGNEAPALAPGASRISEILVRSRKMTAIIAAPGLCFLLRHHRTDERRNAPAQKQQSHTACHGSAEGFQKVSPAHVYPPHLFILFESL